LLVPLFSGQADCKGRDNLLCNLVLKVEDILERAVVALGPQVTAGGGVDQLRVDPYLITSTSDTRS
jgi:hypothetical protein